MSLLIPIGLLGLIGVALLIVIYIIKPNYQQKFISSTYVWRLSLKYRKKSVPISHIKNLLIFLCQLCILAICGLLLAQPVIEYEKAVQKNEKIIIIDASASMLVTDGQQTRFERAVGQVKDYADIILNEGGTITVILADDDADFIMQNVNKNNADEVTIKLDELVQNEIACSYGVADIEGAVSLASDMLINGSTAEVILYTATEYLNDNGISIVPVADDGEWNGAILDCTAKYDNNNHYSVSVDVGCYGSVRSLTVFCKIIGGNGDLNGYEISKTEYFDVTEEEKTITFNTDDFNGTPLLEFDSLLISIKETDSFEKDNYYYVYGGKKQVIKVQYASSTPNNFFAGSIRSIREIFKSNWSIDFDEVSDEKKVATEGYDLYIYEHKMPDKLPSDGIILLVNPDKAPKDAGFTIKGKPQSVSSDSTLATGKEHAITRFVNPNEITIAKYCQLNFDEDYEELMYYMGTPVMAVKDRPDSKIVVLGLDVHFSNLSVSLDFPIIMYNMFKHFIPSTFERYAYEVGETVNFTPRGINLSVRTPDGKEYKYEQIKEDGIVVLSPGAYTTMQDSMRDEYVIEEFFVKVPNSESKITKQVDSLPELIGTDRLSHVFDDLLVYFAIALVVLLFIEWWLHSRQRI